MINKTENFIQSSSPDGGFLQSEAWRKFQAAVGQRTFNIEGDNFWANVIEHSLPLVGKYGYVPRGPIIKSQISNLKSQIDKIIGLAKKEKWGWVRIDPPTDVALNEIEKHIGLRLSKAPHDMQPKQIFAVDLSSDEKTLLEAMSQKTRYNIRLAEKKKVEVVISDKNQPENGGYFEEFFRLVDVTARRNKIVSHPKSYYQKMIEALPAENIRIYVAKYKNEVIAANLVLFFGKYATYLHGASGNAHRNVMAPYLLQWRAMLDAKAAGCEKYDFGGVKMQNAGKWEGITKFKTGFSPNTQPIEYPGSYDIIVTPHKYYVYLLLQKMKGLLRQLR